MSKLVKFDPFAEMDALQRHFFDNDVWPRQMRSVAVPTTDDSELLLKAAEEAKEAKRGMYSAKFWDVTNCILNGVPMPKKDR